MSCLLPMSGVEFNTTDEPAVALWCIFAAGKERDVHRNGVRMTASRASVTLARKPASGHRP